MSLPTASNASARLALCACIALVLLGLGWELWWAPTGRGTLALKVVPLLAALPGLWQRRLYTYRWLSLALWAYAAEGCVRAAGDRGPGAGLALLEVALALLLFVGCAWQVRVQLHERRLALQGSTPSPA